MEEEIVLRLTRKEMVALSHALLRDAEARQHLPYDESVKQAVSIRSLLLKCIAVEKSRIAAEQN